MGDFEYEDYDFDVNEFSSSPPPSPPAYSATLPRSKQPLYGKKTPTPSYASSTPKSSVYEPMVVDRTSRGGVALGRAEEMLRKNKKPISVKAKQVEDLADDTVVDSIASSWDNIMRDFKVEDYDDNVITASVESPSPVEPPDMHFKTPQRLLSISSGGEDSFELTSADFEIGAIASKLTKARVLTREALASESSAPLMPAKLVSSSPDVAKVFFSLHVCYNFSSL